MTQPNMLFIDIETSPNLAYVWRLFKENVSLPQLVDVTQMISFAAKWRGKRQVFFHSDFHDGHSVMVERAFELLEQADVIVHYNGRSFDEPHLNREFLLHPGLGTPPAPYQTIDLLQTVRKRFRFTSNKLDHVTKQLGQAGKVRHTGFQLWVDCMAGDPKAWALMKRYNRGDVTELEEVYEKLLPWIISHPHMGLFGAEQTLDGKAGEVIDRCSRCAGVNLTRQGYAYTTVSKFQRYRCRDCGAWSRGKRAIARVDERGIN